MVRATTLVLGFLSLCPTNAAAAPLYRDVPEGHPAFAAVEALSEEGIVKGYADGTFLPDRSVNRAEALVLLARMFLEPAYVEAFRPSASSYTDVPQGAWFHAEAEVAIQNGLIDGPPKATAFFGERTVILAEFLKMLSRMDRQTVEPFTREGKPLSADVRLPPQWFFSYMAFGVATTVIEPDPGGALHPGKALTRAETAILLYRYAQYREGERLARAEERTTEELARAFQGMRDGDQASAAEASFRSILLVQGMQPIRDDRRTEAWKFLTWATGKLLKGDVGASQAYTERARELDADVYSRIEALAR